MNTLTKSDIIKSERSGASYQAVTESYEGDKFRRIGKIRAVTLDQNLANTDQIFGLAKAAQESIEKVFGITAHDIQLERDRKSYELKTIFQLLPVK